MILRERIQRHFRERLGIQEELNAFGSRARHPSGARKHPSEGQRRTSRTQPLHLLSVPTAR